MNRETVILAGAGLSKPAGLPLANELLQDVRTWLDTSSRRVLDYIYGKLEAWVAINTSTGATVRQTNLEDVVNALLALRHQPRILGPWLAKPDLLADEVIDEVVQSIQTAVCERLSRIRTVDYLAPVADYAKHHGLAIVTLNYDTTVEQICTNADVRYDRGLPIKDGHETFNYYNSTVAFSDEADVHLIKLHGSIDWLEVEDNYAHSLGLHCIATTQPIEDFDVYSTSTESLVLGGPTKLRHRGAFPGLWCHAYQAISNARRLVLVGYSYGDPHVNELIRRFACQRRQPRPEFILLSDAAHFPRWPGDEPRILTRHEFPVHHYGLADEASLRRALFDPLLCELYGNHECRH